MWRHGCRQSVGSEQASDVRGQVVVRTVTDLVVTEFELHRAPRVVQVVEGCFLVEVGNGCKDALVCELKKGLLNRFLDGT